VQKGFAAWGATMLKFAGKAKADNRYLDTTHGTIGFWTDNGGYYHYSTGADKVPSCQPFCYRKRLLRPE
jgi:hypothetical protein